MVHEAYTPSDSTSHASSSTRPHSQPSSPTRRKKHQVDLFPEPHNPVRGETALWVAVITQAMMDALSNSRNPEIQFHKHEAIRWLTGQSKDFITVCHFADLNPDEVRRKAKRAIASPTPWRAEAGKGKRYQERKAYRQQAKAHRALPAVPSGMVIAGPWQPEA